MVSGVPVLISPITVHTAGADGESVSVPAASDSGSTTAAEHTDAGSEVPTVTGTLVTDSRPALVAGAIVFPSVPQTAFPSVLSLSSPPTHEVLVRATAAGQSPEGATRFSVEAV